jgi:acyl-CoA synthetase (NDP forming)/RimJ/RimL family protein N-acetyltransferase
MSTASASAQVKPTPPGYPSSWEFDGLLTTGGAVHVRPIEPDDVTLLAAFYANLTPGTIRSRYAGTQAAPSTEEVSHATEVDYRSRMAFVAIVSEELVALASYDRLSPDERGAEVAFLVADAYQHHGLATLLFESLVAYARTMGIDRFVADVLADNTDMLGVFGAIGLHSTQVNDNATIRVEIDLRPTPEYRASCDQREAVAEAASVAAILRPRSIAVVGAGRHRGSVGHEVVRSLLAGDFSGTVYPVNLTARAISGAPAFSSLSSVPEQVDLAIVAVPAAGVLEVVKEAAASKVRAVTVITAGFAETGEGGAEVETELLGIARRNGMRIVGPNCLGLVNTDPEIRMNGTFTGLDPLAGKLALVSQSGAVGIILAEQASAAGLGLSGFVSVGNKLDVSSNDLLCYFEGDERTSVIALYLESLGNPRKFARIARRVGEHKPIVALKAGRTAAGARGARSHTAAAATPEITVSALLRGAGIIKVDRLEELLDVSAILLASPLPQGRRVALVGNSGGPLILAADACESSGLVVPELGDATKSALEKVLVAAAATANPVDMTADGTAATLEKVFEIVLDDEAIDAVIMVATELLSLSAADARATAARVAEHATKPVIACILGSVPPVGWSGAGTLAEVPTPERVAVALDHVCRYAEWRRRPRPSGERSADRIDNATVREIVAAKLRTSEEGGWLELEEAARLLEACGLPVLATRAASTAEEAASVAESVGLPVVLKARAGDLVHKSDVGGVIVGLDSLEAVREAFETMSSRLGAQMGGAVIQPMAQPGVEAIVGLASDPVFGPVVMVGLGGVMTDLLGDRAFAVPPLDPGAADAMIASLRAAPLLSGYRGTPLVDREALVEIVERVARIAEQVPELIELDLNPIIVSAAGAFAVDCKARLAPRPAGPGPLFRALRSR